METWVKVIHETGYPIFVSLLLFAILFYVFKFALRHLLHIEEVQESNSDTLKDIKKICFKIWEKTLGG